MLRIEKLATLSSGWRRWERLLNAAPPLTNVEAREEGLRKKRKKDNLHIDDTASSTLLPSPRRPTTEATAARDFNGRRHGTLMWLSATHFEESNITAVLGLSAHFFSSNPAPACRHEAEKKLL
ncbi:hypothetical protein HPP92_024899 [Vanilla planifolia]|uniref:Uncharacterized protein n=1 Tax=Vanilla planifolia TaxID=51239 RepID=A0A835PT10_VANPL|nr:hypothetical protein HPP92_024899 [Vanilla planifolia]